MEKRDISKKDLRKSGQLMESKTQSTSAKTDLQTTKDSFSKFDAENAAHEQTEPKLSFDECFPTLSCEQNWPSLQDGDVTELRQLKERVVTYT